MPAIVDITEELIRSHINRAVGDVFRTMLGREPSSVRHGQGVGDASAPPTDNHCPQVVGSVGFVGEINGIVYLHLDLAFARLCTCHLLGMTDAELTEAGDDVINDAIGELTNMTVGSFKNGLCDSGYSCVLTIPSIVRGSNFVIEPISSVTRHTYFFHCEEHRVIADVLIQQQD